MCFKKLSVLYHYHHVSRMRYVLTCNRFHNQKAIDMAFDAYEERLPIGRTPLIIMHSLLGCKDEWRQFGERANRNRKIIALDARNHGKSPYDENHTYPLMVEDVKLFLTQQKLHRACLLGHSMGGNTFAYLALKHPNLVEKLIVVDVSPITEVSTASAIGDILNTMAQVQLPVNMAMCEARICVEKQLAKRIKDPRTRTPLLNNLIQQPDARFTWRSNVSALFKNFYSNILKFPIQGGKFEGPVLFIAGGKSKFVPRTDYSQILELFPNAKFRTIEDAGHFTHLDKPMEFLQICVEFLD